MFLGDFRYRLCVDESGNPHVTSKALERERYLGITGCIFSELRESHLEQRLDEIRAKHFPEWPREAVNFHATIS